MTINLSNIKEKNFKTKPIKLICLVALTKHKKKTCGKEAKTEPKQKQKYKKTRLICKFEVII